MVPLMLIDAPITNDQNYVHEVVGGECLLSLNSLFYFQALHKLTLSSGFLIGNRVWFVGLVVMGEKCACISSLKSDCETNCSKFLKKSIIFFVRDLNIILFQLF